MENKAQYDKIMPGQEAKYGVIGTRLYEAFTVQTANVSLL